MRIVKSLHGGVLHKTFDYREKHQFAISTLWGFRLTDQSPVLEQALWTAIGSTLESGQVFDIAMPKSRAEVLVQGSFHAPGGNPVAAGKVAVKFGAISKELAVFGDRYWIRSLGTAVGVTDPVPIAEMPIVYARAFGGEAFPRNPAGKGMVEVDVDGEPRLPLPNIEYFDALIGAPGDRPRPAGLAATDMMWEPRISRAGTYDQKYIEQRMPGLPDDIDWSYFNAAAEDQWIAEFWRGDESYELLNMHPEHEYIRGRLPGVYGRCFVSQKTGEQTEFKSIDTRLDTVWLFPGQNLGVLIHRGTLEVGDSDGRDIVELVVAHESMNDEPRPADFYQQELRKRMDPEEGFKYLMDSTPFIPDGCRCGFKVLHDESDFPLELLGKSNMEAFSENQRKNAEQQIETELDQLTAKLRESGVSDSFVEEQLKAHQAVTAAPVEELPEVIRLREIMESILPGVMKDPENVDISRLNLKGMDDLKAYLEQLAEEKRAEASATINLEIEKLKNNPDLPEAGEQMRQLETLLDEQTPGPTPLPRIDLDGQLDALETEYRDNVSRQLQELHASGIPLENLPTADSLDLQAMRQQLHEVAEQFRQGYRMGAHYMPVSTSPHPGQEAEIAAKLLADHGRGEVTANGDYAFLDLSAQDLTGIDLSDSFLEYVNFRGAVLNGANLRGAILAHADLSGAELTGADLSNANLGGTNLSATRFTDADLSNAMLGKAKLDATLFHRCKLTDRIEMFLEAEVRGVDFSESDLGKAVFLDADLRDCCFRQARLTEANFVNPVLERAQFDGADLTGCNMVRAQAAGASFVDANLENTRFVGGCNLMGCDFSGAAGKLTSFRESMLENAKFCSATMDQADFGDADLRFADLSRMSAIRAQFSGADMRNSDLTRSNLMEASLYKSRLSGAVFVDGNFYAANFMQSTLGDNDFSGAYLEQTIIKDWRPS